jgi:hypothetical protein
MIFPEEGAVLAEEADLVRAEVGRPLAGEDVTAEQVDPGLGRPPD